MVVIKINSINKKIGFNNKKQIVIIKSDDVIRAQYNRK